MCTMWIASAIVDSTSLPLCSCHFNWLDRVRRGFAKMCPKGAAPTWQLDSPHEGTPSAHLTKGSMEQFFLPLRTWQTGCFDGREKLQVCLKNSFCSECFLRSQKWGKHIKWGILLLEVAIRCFKFFNAGKRSQLLPPCDPKINRYAKETGNSLLLFSLSLEHI